MAEAWADIVFVALLVAPLSWSITECGRQVTRRFKETCAGDPFWWQWGIRLFAVLVGAGLGLLMMPTAVGAVAGTCGGVLSSTIVYSVKRYIKRFIGMIPPSE